MGNGVWAEEKGLGEPQACCHVLFFGIDVPLVADRFPHVTTALPRLCETSVTYGCEVCVSDVELSPKFTLQKPETFRVVGWEPEDLGLSPGSSSYYLCHSEQDLSVSLICLLLSKGMDSYSYCWVLQ